MSGPESATAALFSGNFTTQGNQWVGSNFNAPNGNIQFIQQRKLPIFAGFEALS